MRSAQSTAGNFDRLPESTSPPALALPRLPVLVIMGLLESRVLEQASLRTLYLPPK